MTNTWLLVLSSIVFMNSERCRSLRATRLEELEKVLQRNFMMTYQLSSESSMVANMSVAGLVLTAVCCAPERAAMPLPVQASGNVYMAYRGMHVD